MANSDKNIVITPFISGTTQPNIVFTGQGNDPITLRVLDGTTGTGITAGGALSFEGSAGQLFSVVNRLGTGSIFSVNDISGIPSLDVDASGRIHMAAFTGFVGVGLTAPSQKLHVSGNALITGDIALNGGTLSTTSTTANLFNTTATTLNIGGAGVTGNIFGSSNAMTLNIANGMLTAGGAKAINIATLSPITGTQTVTLGAGIGQIATSPSAGITFGQNMFSQPTTIRMPAPSSHDNIVIAENYTFNVRGISAAGISSGAYILTSAGIKSLTGTTYTFLASDNGDVLTHDNSSGCTFTIPTGLPVGYSTTIIRLNASGRVGFTAASGVTLNSYNGWTAIAGQHASASLISYATNIFNLSGTVG